MGRKRQEDDPWKYNVNRFCLCSLERQQHLFCPEVLHQRLGCGIALYLDIDSHTCKDVYNKIGAINKVQVELATVLPHQ